MGAPPFRATSRSDGLRDAGRKREYKYTGINYNTWLVCFLLGDIKLRCVLQLHVQLQRSRHYGALTSLFLLAATTYDPSILLLRSLRALLRLVILEVSSAGCPYVFLISSSPRLENYSRLLLSDPADRSWIDIRIKDFNMDTLRVHHEKVKSPSSTQWWQQRNKLYATIGISIIRPVSSNSQRNAILNFAFGRIL